MDSFEEEYNYGTYWDTNMFFENEELDRYWETPLFPENEGYQSWGPDEHVSGGSESSSPEGSTSSAATKNIVMERNRRKKFNESLYNLRSEVPNISKLDKASIIKDAIEYIQELQEQERKILSEITETDSGTKEEKMVRPISREMGSREELQRKKKRTVQSSVAAGRPATMPSLDVMDLRVSEVGDSIFVINLTCNKNKNTTLKVCEVFESLDLKILTANMTTFSGRLLHTLFVETNDFEKAHLREKIEMAIAELNTMLSPMSC